MHLFRMYWQRTLRRPGSILLWLALPFVFMAIYTMVFGNDSSTPRISMAIVDQDSSFVSQLAKGAFRQGPVASMIDVVDAPDMKTVDELFRAEKASAALVIPDGFGDRLLLQMEPQTLKLFTNPRHTIGPEVAEGVVRTTFTLANGLLDPFRYRGTVDRIRMIKGQLTADDIAAISKEIFEVARDTRGISAIQNIDVTVIKEKEDTETDSFNLAALFFPGFVMFGLLSVSLHLEHRFLFDRTRFVTRRFVTAPISPWSVSIQQRFYIVSFVYVVGMLSAALGGLIWKIPPHGLGAAGLIALALALFVSGFNGVMFSLSSSTRAVSAISSIAMVFLAILGGGFFPTEFTPPAFQSVLKLIPTGMANVGLTHALTGRPLGISIPVLFAYCGAFFVAGTVAGRRRIL